MDRNSADSLGTRLLAIAGIAAWLISAPAQAFASGPFRPGYGGGSAFFRESGDRSGQPSIDVLGGIGIPLGKVEDGVKASLSPVAAVSANFFVSGPLWAGIRGEWERKVVENAGTRFYTVNALSFLAQIEFRLKEKGDRFGGYLNFGIGGNINLADVAAGLVLPDGTPVTSVDIAHTVTTRTSLGLEWEFSKRLKWVVDLGFKANALGKTTIRTAAPSTIRANQNLSSFTVLTGPRLTF